MEYMALVVPVLPGKTEAVRNFYKSIKDEKWKEYDESQRESGIIHQRDFIQTTPMGDFVIIYLESNDMQKSFGAFAMSKNPFDVWAKNEIKNFSGFDFGAPPSGPLPEMVAKYDQ